MSREISRPWVGRMWAVARVDDLAQEMALTGERTELRDEIIDLALAYNFATPYTAFLAIPASELDAASASQLHSARMRKAEILRRRPEAIGVNGDPRGAEVRGRERVAMNDQLLSGDGRRHEQRNVQKQRSVEQERRVASAEEAENPLDSAAPVSNTGSSAKRNLMLGRNKPEKAGRDSRGCASCTLGGGASGTLTGLLLLAAACVAARRRRRGCSGGRRVRARSADARTPRARRCRLRSTPSSGP
jgi:hypothetical protein